MRKRNIYLVTSVLGNRNGITSAPVLGAFSSKAKANEHYLRCIHQATSYQGSKLAWDTTPCEDFGEGYIELRRAYISHKDYSHTIIALQKRTV